MKVRFRHLAQAGVDQGSQPWRRPEGAGVGMRRHEAPPMAIEAQDGEASLEELTAWLEAGRLGPRDLVDLGRGWETIADTPELGELAARLPEPRPPIPRHALRLLVAAGLLFAGLLGDRLLHTGGSLFLAGFVAFVLVVFVQLFAWMAGPSGKDRPSVSTRPFDSNRRE